MRRTVFLVFILAELTSLTGYFYPWLNTVGFLVIAGVALVFALRRLEYGLSFVLADLILGGKSGALFSLQVGDFFLSLRMALFIVVMAVWIAKILLRYKLTIVNLYRSRAVRWWAVLGIAVIWGMVRGLEYGNGFGNVFLDANGYFYAALVLPVWWVFRGANNESATNLRISNSQIRKFGLDSQFAPVVMVFFVATTLLAFKTLFAVYWFTHAGNNFIGANLVPFYRWVRDTGVGEITWLPGNFARVFFQSQIYNVLAFFLLLTAFITPPSSPYLKGRKLLGWALVTLNAAVIIVSLSRSFWVGVLAGLFIVAVGHIRHIRQIGQIAWRVAIAGIASVALLLIVSRFPLPKPAPADLGSAVQSRLEAGEAGASRWNLFSPLVSAGLKHPLIGSGFGTTVTYISNDPRIREVSRTGEYTTYAFEWGWLDIWLKMGVLGLIGLMGLIGHLGRALYRQTQTDPLALAGLASLASLAAIHFFTPYLNHPLGLGGLLMLTGLVYCQKRDIVKL